MSAARHLAGFAAALTSLLFGACTTSPHLTAPAPPPPQNYFSPHTPHRQHAAADPRGGAAADLVASLPLRRVALLPLWSEKLPGEYLRDMDAAFSSELTKKSVFEVVPVSRSQMESLFGARQFSSVEALPAEALAQLRAQFGVEGVLLTDLTSFSPYRPLSMGVRAKLIDVATGEIRWAFDYIYDTGNASVAAAAKRYQLQYSNEHQPLTSDGGSILLSPSRFTKYVASETYGSLQAQEAPGIFSAKASASPDR